MKEVGDFIQRNNSVFNASESWCQLLITHKETKDVIGDIGIHFLGSENSQVELGITLNTSFQGQGYAYEALKGIINFLFNDLNKHRVTASIDPDNTDSLKLMERIGLIKEGHFVKSLFCKNNWVDDVIYAVLREEWVKK